jgi:hypothetical protein
MPGRDVGEIGDPQLIGRVARKSRCTRSQPQRIERKLLAQTVRTDGQSLSHGR